MRLDRKHVNTRNQTKTDHKVPEPLQPTWSDGSSSTSSSSNICPQTPTVAEKMCKAFRPDTNVHISIGSSSSRRSACIATTASPTTTTAAAAAAAPAAAAAAYDSPPRRLHSAAAMHKFAKALAEAGIEDPAVLAFAGFGGLDTTAAAAAAAGSGYHTALDSTSSTSSSTSTSSSSNTVSTGAINKEDANAKQSIQQLATALAQAGLHDPGLDMLAHSTHRSSKAAEPAAPAAVAAAPQAVVPGAQGQQEQEEKAIHSTSSSSSSGNANLTWIQKLVALERRSSSSSGSSNGSGMISAAVIRCETAQAAAAAAAAAAATPTRRLLTPRGSSARQIGAANAGSSRDCSARCRCVGQGPKQGATRPGLQANSGSSSSSSCQIAEAGSISWVQALAAKDNLRGATSGSSCRDNSSSNPAPVSGTKGVGVVNSNSRKETSTSGKAGSLRRSAGSLGSSTAVNFLPVSEVGVHLKRRSTSSNTELGGSSSSGDSAKTTKIARSPVAPSMQASRGNSRHMNSKRHWLHRLAACSGSSSSTKSDGGLVMDVTGRMKAA